MRTLDVVPIWQYNLLTTEKKRRYIVAVFTAAYVPISSCLVICKRLFALGNWYKDENNNG